MENSSLLMDVVDFREKNKTTKKTAAQALAVFVLFHFSYQLEVSQSVSLALLLNTPPCTGGCRVMYMCVA